MTPFAESILSEILAVENYLHAVSEILSSGRLPEMVGLDTRVGELCQRAQAATAEDQAICLPRLKELLNKISVCENEMRVFHNHHMGLLDDDHRS